MTARITGEVLLSLTDDVNKSDVTACDLTEGDAPYVSGPGPCPDFTRKPIGPR